MILGEIGEHITIARRRGSSWFLGAITNNDARTLEIPLGFLDPANSYSATLYTDGDSTLATRTRVRIEQFPVTSASRVQATLQPSGGLAMEIVPLSDGVPPAPTR